MNPSIQPGIEAVDNVYKAFPLLPSWARVGGSWVGTWRAENSTGISLVESGFQEINTLWYPCFLSHLLRVTQ